LSTLDRQPGIDVFHHHAQGRQAQWRPCQLKAGPLKGVADCVERYRRFWEKNEEST
jgi:hypothetical protein